MDRAGPGLSEPVEDRSERGAYAVRLEALASRGRDAARAVRLLAQTVQRVVDWCRAIPAQAPALELLDAWWDAVSKLGLLEPPAESRLPPLSSTMSAEVDRALARDQAAIEALGALLGELKEALTRSGLGRRSMSRREFSRWVRLAAADANLVARGPRVGAVWLLDAREVAGRRFAQLFLGGLLDGRFPGRPAPLALLGEEERAVLNRAAQRALFRMSVGEGDVRLGVRLAEDRLLFHLALSSAASVTVSRARVDDAGRELLASPFRDALLRCVTGFREEHLHRSAVPSLDEVQHDAELRVRAALEVHSPAATRQTPQDPRRAALAALLEDEPWFRAAADKGRIEAERLRFFTDPSMAAGPYTGRVEGEVLEALRGRLTFDAAHPVAAHELSQWGSCAFKGLATMVLGLEAGDEAGEELDARARGTFWHDALAKVVPALSAAGLLGKDDPETRAHLEAVIPEVAAEVAKRSSTGHPALWSLAQEWARTVLGRLVAAPEAALPFEGARPKFVEVSFGAKDSPDALREVRLPAARPGEQDVFCTGRMDRVDVGPGAVGVIDYKTSVSGSLKSDFLVREFQMALYVLAAKALAPDATANGAWVGIGRSELKTLSSVMGQAPLDALVATDAEARAKAEHEATPNLANAVHGLLGRLRAGDFGARPLDCDFCDLKPVCRISQRQLSEDAS